MTRSGQMASTDSSNESGGAEAQKLQLVLAMGCTCSLELAVQLVAYGKDQQTLVIRCRGTAASADSCNAMTCALGPGGQLGDSDNDEISGVLVVNILEGFIHGILTLFWL